MEIFIDILALAALAHVLVEFIQNFNIPQLNIKPFNCNLCMGFWVAILPGFIDYGLWGLPFAALTAITSETIYKLINRL